jgi:hypothetical protein
VIPPVIPPRADENIECPSCGERNTLDSQFCTSCGTRLST